MSIKIILGGMCIEYFVVIFSLVAVCFDLKTYKIPNWLNLFGIMLGMSFNTYLYGLYGLLVSSICMLIPFVLLFLLFGIRVIGAGDIKLFCAIACFVGWSIINVIINSFLCAALIAIFIVVAKLIGGEYIKGRMNRMHLSVPIFLGTIITLQGGEWFVY